MPLKKVINKQLGELLIDFGVINSVQLEKALEAQKVKGGLIGELLVEMGFAKEEDIAQTLTVQYGFPYLPLSSYEISSEIVNLIPLKISRQYVLIPIDKIGNSLTLVMSNPLNAKVIEEVETLSGCNVQVFVSTPSDIKKAIEKYYKIA
jgi:type IV pilus assembly protein PilB